MVQLNLLPEPRSAAVARSHVRDLPLDDETVEVLSLLVTELITNAVRHGNAADGTRILVELKIVDDDLVRVDVVNEGHAFEPTPGERRPADAEGGLGLALVDRLAERWGVEGDGVTKVWLELRRTH
jgi:anti-sigma regulatory factor (Ser/Thr protein kinase)